MLVAHGRRALSASVSEWLSLFARMSEVEFIPIDNEIAAASVNLPGTFHKDPADRFIAATARAKSCPIVTADEKLRAYPHVRTIW